MRMDWFGALGAALEFNCSSLAKYCSVFICEVIYGPLVLICCVSI